MNNVIKRAPFSGEFIVKEEEVLRPVVTVLRDKECFARGEKDLIICGVCGSIMNYKQKYCGGCGAKFKRITLEEAKKLDVQVKEQTKICDSNLPRQQGNENHKGQMDLEDWLNESKESE